MWWIWLLYSINDVLCCAIRTQSLYTWWPVQGVMTKQPECYKSVHYLYSINDVLCCAIRTQSLYTWWPARNCCLSLQSITSHTAISQSADRFLTCARSDDQTTRVLVITCTVLLYPAHTKVEHKPNTYLLHSTELTQETSTPDTSRCRQLMLIICAPDYTFRTSLL
jgi:hypothetical protein